MGIVIEPKPGTYALILSCASNARLQIGRLGIIQLQCGYYVYVGSALGAGGLRSRITHHQKLSAQPHWHIDYLRAHTRLHSVLLDYDGIRHEHEWARAVQEIRDATIPILGFGASDCSCLSHLYFFKRCPTQLPALNTRGKRKPTIVQADGAPVACREFLRRTGFCRPGKEQKQSSFLPGTQQPYSWVRGVLGTTGKRMQVVAPTRAMRPEP
jgi:Uri superfamily endonuclease